MLETILGLYLWMCVRIVSALLVAYTFLVFALVLDFTAHLIRNDRFYTGVRIPYEPWWRR